MHLVLSGLQSIGAPFESFSVENAAIQTDDVRSLYAVLLDLGDRGLVDSCFYENTLRMKCSKIGRAEIVTSQIKGKYDINLSEGQSNCSTQEIQRQIFYRAFRRLLISRGFRTGIKPSLKRMASPSHGDPASRDFVLRVAGDNVFLQGFRYLLELRSGGCAMLWLDPKVAIFNTFSGKFLNKNQIITAGLVPELKKWSVLEPQSRLAKANSIVSHLCNGNFLEVQYADGTKASFSKDFMGVAKV